MESVFPKLPDWVVFVFEFAVRLLLLPYGALALFWFSSNRAARETS